MNDGIYLDWCSLSYASVDQVAKAAVWLGKGALMVMINIESVYLLIPVHPHVHPLQAVQWKGKVYIGTMLCFGLRSAPKIFNALVMHLSGMCVCKVLSSFSTTQNDFRVLGTPDSPHCVQAMPILDNVCTTLGVPTVEHKRDGLTAQLMYLGIEVDTVAGGTATTS